MLTPEQTKEFATDYHRKHEAAVEVVLEAICQTIKNLTGAYPNDRFKERLWETIQFDV